MESGRPLTRLCAQRAASPRKNACIFEKRVELFRHAQPPCVKGAVTVGDWGIVSGGELGNLRILQQALSARYGAPAEAQRKRVRWGEEVRRRERDLPRLSGARRGIHSPHRRDGGIDRLTSQSQACQPGGDASRWGFLLSGQKEPKSA